MTEENTSVQKDADFFPYAATAACGLVVYIVIVAATGKNEAWDDGSYYALGIPLMCVVAFFIGNRFPTKPWRWALSMAGGQMAGALLNGSSLNLLPLALIFRTIISIPQFVAASLGARLARRRAAE